MRSYNKVLALLVSVPGATGIIMATPMIGQSQIYQCNGTWTNQPCAGATPHFEEIPSSSPAAGDEIKKAKNAIVHQLIELRYRVKDRFSLDIQTSSVEKFCAREDISPTTCQERVDTERDKIDSKVIEVQKLKLQEQELALKKQELGSAEQNNSTAVIIQNIGTIRATPTGTVYGPPHHIGRPPIAIVSTPAEIPALSRGEVPNDARVPLQH